MRFLRDQDSQEREAYVTMTTSNGVYDGSLQLVAAQHPRTQPGQVRCGHVRNSTKGPISSRPEPRVRLSRRDANHSDGPYQESWGNI